MDTTEIILLTICILLVLGIVVGFIYFKVNKYLNINKRMGVYADMPMSIKNNSMYLNFVNIKEDSMFLSASEDDLKMFAMGTPIEAVFYRSKDVPNGLKINVNPPSLSNMQFLSLIGGVKYNAFEMSYDNGETRIKVNSVKDSIAKGITQKMQEMRSYNSDDLRNEIVNEIVKSPEGLKYEELESGRAISHVNERKTTATSMRFQVIIPKNHFIMKNGFEPENPDMSKFFFVYEGHCYEIPSKFVESVENFFEWDLIGLNPGTIYTGLSFSIDGGKTILPSTALYGVTKGNDGQLPTIDETELGKPNESNKQYPMWTEEQAIGYLGAKQAQKNYDVIVKKHYEDDYTEQYLALSNASTFHDEYDWLKQGK